ncbi:MAG: hypothetical protein IAG13_21170, partial [Deltaproteobacteria bacterium]|nr:hypothetical protein [Nannocystaceae bacterium]
MSTLALLLLAASPAIAAPQPVPSDAREPIDEAEFAIAIDAPTPHADAFVGQRPPQRLGAKILYVNFDGGQMQGGCGNDPGGNCSSIFQGVVLPYSGDAAKRASVIQVIRSRVEDFGITITNVRPASGDYDMEMVGNWQGEMTEFAGIAPSIDCWDQDGGQVSFTLESAQSADGIAEIVLQEAAHTWGMEHVDVQTDLLYPTTSGTNKTFNDACGKIVEDTMLNESDGWCNQVHTNFCDSGWQNSYQELLLVFGESIADTIAPTVEIVEPASGAQIAGDFDLVIDIADDQSPVVVDMIITLDSPALEMPSSSPAAAYVGPGQLSFPVEDLPEGDYTVHVAITDESGNPAETQIAFSMLAAAADTSGGGSDEAGSSSSEATTETSAATRDTADTGVSGAAESSGVTAAGETTSDEGCACSQPGERYAPPALLGMLALALVPRRRR